MAARRERAELMSQEELCPGIMSMWLRTGMGRGARAGQFISVYSRDSARILPRPFGICETDPAGNIRIVYRVVGAGTREFAQWRPGEPVEILGPLGNGFPLEEAAQLTSAARPALLIGGGSGIPPILHLAQRLPGVKTAALGYRDAHTFLRNDFLPWARVLTATDDGSEGIKGTVLDAVKAEGLLPGIIYACGPLPMLRAVKDYAEERQIPCYISLEERMACGIGACLACVCESREVDGHSLVHNKRICKDGPVFAAGEVRL